MNHAPKHAKDSTPFYKRVVYKNPIAYIALVLVLCLGVSCAATPAATNTDVIAPSAVDESTPETPTNVETPTDAESPTDVESTVSSHPVPGKKPSSNKTTTNGTGSNYKKFGYNANLDIEDNVFMDALIYTGYNIKKHRADGNMWVYILSKQKRGLGYLSNITYGGGCTGLETTADGLPDLKAFERGGLVCASFATYVYFNYLPNVAGIDTSFLTKPERSYNAHSFYTAAKDWVKKGHTYNIAFTAKKTSSNYIVFNPKEEIPIGSIIVFENDERRDGLGSHITVYAGYKNGYHWVFQVGTKNGPEFSAVERMLLGPEAQWPLAIFARPPAFFPEKTVTDTNKK